MKQCWNTKCTSSECDGENHISSTGRFWSERPRVMVRQVFVIQEFDGLDWDDLEDSITQDEADLWLKLYRDDYPKRKFRVIGRYLDSLAAA